MHACLKKNMPKNVELLGLFKLPYLVPLKTSPPKPLNYLKRLFEYNENFLFVSDIT
jgi:hypothetical protein